MNDGATTPRLPDSNSMRSCPAPSPEPSGAENHSRTTEASSTHSRTDVGLASRVPLGPDRRRGVLVGEPGEESVDLPEQPVIDRNQHLHAPEYIQISRSTGRFQNSQIGLYRPALT